ncbi:MAG: 5'-nucleotidase C-terminal domain-containing protein, partial [Elusimicrobiota bacterium]
DATVLGNHEYDLGEGPLKELVAKIEIPVLGANVYESATGKRVPYVRPYILKEMGGLQIGIFGLITSDMGNLQFAKNITGLEFRGEIETAEAMVKELKAKGADIIVLLSHVGYERGKIKLPVSEQDIAEQVPGIDLIVSGHIHIPTSSPVLLKNKTWLVNAGGYLKAFGKVVLVIDPEAKKLVTVSGGNHKLWIDEFPEDEEALAITKKHLESVGRLLNVDIGSSEAALDRAKWKDSPVANWVTDCVRKWTKTQIAVQNATGVRTSLAKGPVQLRHMYEIMPFDNRLVTLYMSGKSLLKLLEQGASDAPGYLQVSGLRYALRPKGPKGSRIVWAEVGGRRVHSAGVYSVTAPDFLVEGGDGYKAFSEGRDIAYTPTKVRDAMIWCAKTYSPIRMPDGNRIVKQ